MHPNAEQSPLRHGKVLHRLDEALRLLPPTGIAWAVEHVVGPIPGAAWRITCPTMLQNVIGGLQGMWTTPWSANSSASARRERRNIEVDIGSSSPCPWGRERGARMRVRPGRPRHRTGPLSIWRPAERLVHRIGDSFTYFEIPCSHAAALTPLYLATHLASNCWSS